MPRTEASSEHDGRDKPPAVEVRSYEAHEHFTSPPPDARLWRYLDLARFVSLRDTSALFFPQVDALGDPYEGTYSRANVARRPQVYDQPTRELMERAYGTLAILRPLVYISCWHENDYESAAMWELYGRSNRAVAIQTTFKRLTGSFGAIPGQHERMDRHVYVGRVSYIDYDKDWIPEENLFVPFLHKRKSFEHEREVRVIAARVPPDSYLEPDAPPPPSDGILVRTDLGTLVEGVFVAPNADSWFAELVTRVIMRWGLDFQVNQSDLSRDPVQ